MSTSFKRCLMVMCAMLLLTLQLNTQAGIRLVSSTGVSAAYSNDITGDWKAKIEGNKIKFQLSYEHPNTDGYSNISLELDKNDISNFTYDKEFTFQIKRECGSASFTGKFSGNKGKGEFEFSIDNNFEKFLNSKNFTKIKEENYLIFFAVNITKNYINGLDKLGYGDISASQLVSFAIFKVTPEFIKDIHAAGCKDISAQKLVDFKIFKVTPEFIKDIADCGFKNLPEQKLIDFKIFKVTPKYIKEIAAAGINNIRPQNLIDFKIFKITDKFIQKVKNIKRKKELSAGYIVNAKIVGVRIADDDEYDEDND